MRIAALLLLACLATMELAAQDKIILRTGEEINGKVTTVTPEFVEYTKASSPDGPAYKLMNYQIFKITYSNGRSEMFTQYSRQETPSAEQADPAATRPAEGDTPYDPYAAYRKKKPTNFKKSGFTSINELGVGTEIPNLSDGYNESYFRISFYSINGKQYSGRGFWGIGTGVIGVPAREGVQIPLFFHWRTDFNEKRFRPYISISAGGTVTTPTYFEPLTFGGIAEAGIGFKRYINEKTALVFSITPHFSTYHLAYGFSARVGLSF